MYINGQYIIHYIIHMTLHLYVVNLSATVVLGEEMMFHSLLGILINCVITLFYFNVNVFYDSYFHALFINMLFSITT